MDTWSGSRPLLAPDCIVLLQSGTREEVLRAAAHVLHREHGVVRATAFDRLRRREERQSTALGFGVAVPHADMPALGRAVAAFVRVRKGVDFAAPDRSPVHDLFVLLVPRPATTREFELLVHYKRLLARPEVRDALREARTEGAIWRLFQQPAWRPAILQWSP